RRPGGSVVVPQPPSGRKPAPRRRADRPDRDPRAGGHVMATRLLDNAQLGQLAGSQPATIKKTAQAAGATTAPAPIAMPWRAWAKNNALGVNLTWREIRAGRLKVKRVGKRMLILDEDGRAFLQTLPEG